MSTLPAVEPMTGAEFKNHRRSIGFTQEALARHLDVSYRTIQKIEAAKDQPVDTRTALAMLKLLDDAEARRNGSTAVAEASEKPSNS